MRPDAATSAARIASARRDARYVLLEGIHAYKHAVRFGADVEVVATCDRGAATALLAELAPDVALPTWTVDLDTDAWRALAPRELPSPLLAVAVRPVATAADVLAAPGRTIVLDQPRHLGNLGAAIRVAAAADAGGVLVLGDADPWHPTAVRAAAGLQFAVTVARVDRLPATTRPVLVLDPEGEDAAAGAIPADAVLVVGSERTGASPEVLARADHRIRLPMRAGVSSLNLATAVAAALYR